MSYQPYKHNPYSNPQSTPYPTHLMFNTTPEYQSASAKNSVHNYQVYPPSTHPPSTQPPSSTTRLTTATLVSALPHHTMLLPHMPGT